MEFKKEYYNCACCNNTNTKEVTSKQGFSIVQCTNCGFVYVNPRIDNNSIASLYRHNYFHNKDYGYNGYEQEKRLRIKNFDKWLSDAAPFMENIQPFYALDAGCAAGYCLEVMQQKGLKAEGIELDEEMYKNLLQQGYKVSPGLLQDFSASHKFSLITLFDVIEHIPDIDEVFKKLHELLSDNGVVVMVTPNHNSLQRKLLGRRWFQYKPIEHIQYFTLNSITQFATRNNFEVVYHTSCGQYADTTFLINRLNYYGFSFFSKLFSFFFSITGLKNKFFYTDTGSLLLVLKKKP